MVTAGGKIRRMSLVVVVCFILTQRHLRIRAGPETPERGYFPDGVKLADFGLARNVGAQTMVFGTACCGPSARLEYDKQLPQSWQLQLSVRRMSKN